MTLPGRNAPCPCGSGRKFKHCCLPKHQPAARAYTDRERQGALERLARFVRSDAFAEEVRLARLLFWSGRLELVSPEQRRQLESDESLLYAFTYWLFFDFSPDDGDDPVATRFLAAHGHTLTPGERTWLGRMAASGVRLYEIQDVRREEGLTLKDLWTDQTVDVRERSATRQLVRWDLLAVRVIQGPDGPNEMEGTPYLFPPGARDGVLHELRRLHKAFARRRPPDDAAAFFKEVGARFHHLWIDHYYLTPRPTLVTVEGDPVVFAKMAFDVSDHASLTATLAGHADLDLQDDGSYVWMEPAGEQRRVLGFLRLTPGRLTLDTTSEERAERGRAFVERLGGDAVRFRLTRSEEVSPAAARVPKNKRRAAAELPPEVEREVVSKFYEQHYRAWLDEPIPALGGRTPRKAARLKTVRPALVALLKDLENHMSRQALEGQPAFDLAWMWGELGVERS